MLTVRDLRPEELAAAGGVAGRALADSPIFRFIAGDDVQARVERALDVFVGYVDGLPPPQMCALLGAHVVGVCAAVAPGTCVGATAPAAWRDAPEEIGPPGDETRAVAVWSLYYRHDLGERHWHVGPVAVEPRLQGAGIGGAMVAALCARFDEAGEMAWLETDKPENVVFYRRHGFAVVDEIEAYGFTTWFMRRDPQPPEDRPGEASRPGA